MEYQYHNTDCGVIIHSSGSRQGGRTDFSILPRERLISDIEKRVITLEKILQEIATDLLIEPSCKS
jgi:hypothetical protein